MGWLYMPSLDGHKTPKAYLDAVFTWSNENGDRRVLKSSATGSVYYAAVEHSKPDGELIVFAVICLYRYRPSARDGHVFGYKDMDETVGPYECQCPVSILDLLTPTTYDYAIRWRADCRANAEKRRVARAKPAPKAGQIVVLDEPLHFTDGQVLDRFKIVQYLDRYGRSKRFYRSLANGGLYRIRKLAARQYRIEEAAD